MRLSTFLFLLFISLTACKTSSPNKNEIRVSLTSKSKSEVTGSAVFTQKKDKVLMQITLKGLTPGVHAIHLHEKADCSAEDGLSTGGHWNPTYKKHGKWGDLEHHKGDIGNFTANENGNASISFSTNQWCIGCDDPTKDITGKALIIHKGSDDFVTQPTGNAGARIACAGIIK